MQSIRVSFLSLAFGLLTNITLTVAIVANLARLGRTNVNNSTKHGLSCVLWATCAAVSYSFGFIPGTILFSIYALETALTKAAYIIKEK